MKSKFPLITGLCLAAFALCANPAASAKDKKSAAPEATASATPMEKADKPARPIAFHGKVGTVDASAKTFTIAGKSSSRVLKVTDKTEIVKNGASATMADIVADEEVRGSYWKQADGTLEAKKVSLGPKSDGEKAAHPRKKKAKESTEASPAATP